MLRLQRWQQRTSRYPQTRESIRPMHVFMKQKLDLFVYLSIFKSVFFSPISAIVEKKAQECTLDSATAPP